MRYSAFSPPRLPRATIAALLALSALPAAAAAQTPTPLMISGTEGRDEVSVEDTGSSKTRIAVSGAASVTGPGCAPVVDRLGTTTAFSCSRGAPVQITLGGNDDLLTLKFESGSETVTVDGGAGNDVLVVASQGPRTLSGGLGDDTLAPGSPGASQSAATLDGGAGRDLVDYNDSPGGVNASIATRSATVFSRIQSDPATGQSISSTSPSPIRTDTLGEIERLSGSNEPDRLAGGTLADDLLGGGGADILVGGDGDDILDGGPSIDALDGGAGRDTQIGGPGRDTFRAGSGGDNYQTRDGFIEEITCATGDSLVGDLVDRITSPANCNPLSIAAGKHVFDTQLSRRAVVVRAGRAVRTSISCPEEKPEECAGTLRFLVAGEALSRVRYRVRPGRTRTVLLRLTPAEAARARRAGRVTLEGLETDDDGRPRRVVRQLRVSR